MFPFEYFDASKPLLSVAIGLTTIFILNQILSKINRIRKLPRGPWGLPILGYLPFIKEDSYICFDKLAKNYGPVYSVKLGQFDVVVICDWEHLKLAFSDESLLGRPRATFLPGIIDDPSLIEMSGQPWREHRRLSLHILRDVGFGKSFMETMITEEIDRLLPTLNGVQNDFIQKLHPSVSNVISIFLFGHSFDYTDPFKIALDESIESTGSNFQHAGIQAFLPWLTKYLAAIGWGNMAIIVESMEETEKLIQMEVDKHVEKKVNTEEVTDYIEGYLLEQKNLRKKGNGNDSVFKSDTLRRNVSDFFAAGSDTIATTVSWALMNLIKYPEYQDKIHSEITEIIGYERKPNYTDRNQMPFTMAFLYEVQRVSSIVATNLIRRATCDTKIGEYNIPKDTLVFFNFWSIHHEDKLWPEPEKFDPNRFLVENGSKAFKPPFLVPFSGGKRICLGESLANVELFLYTVGILQKYRVKVPPGTTISMEASYGVIRKPKHLPTLIFEAHN